MNNIEGELREKARNILTDAVTEIKAKMQSENINASGRTSDSLRLVEDDKGFKIVIGGTNDRTAPLGTLEIGRKGGAVPKNIKAILVEWTKDKGVQVDSESHRWAIATIIARNIAERGTQRHSQPVDVYTSVIASTKVNLESSLKGVINQIVITKIRNFNQK